MRLPFLAIVVCCWLPYLAWGQEDDRLFLPLDVEAPADFKRVEGLATRGQWDRVVTELDRMLAAGGGKLIERDGAYVTVRAEARRRLLELPDPGLRAYALVHADPARRTFEQGLDQRGLLPFERLLAEHPASELVDRAREVLATRYFERGQPGAALLQVEALLARLPDVGHQTRLLRLRAECLATMGRTAEAIRALADLDVPPEDADPLRARLSALGPAPLVPAPAAQAPVAWGRPVFGFYGADGYQAPWSLPRADLDRAYLHDGSHAQALDLDTGKVAWRTALGEHDAFVRPSGLCRLALSARVVVCVLPGPQGGLIGLDRRSGRLLWRRTLTELKRAAEVDFPAHLSGRPEVVGDVVALNLVTDHQDKEVHTLAVDLRSGELAWSVFLASEHEGRAPLPYLAQGLERLFVITGLGATAALDLSGEILWLRTYKSKRSAPVDRRNPFDNGGLRRGGGGQPERDPTAVVTRGVLWAAPADATGFLAWDARTGEPRATQTAPAQGRILGPRGAGVLVLSGQGDLLQLTRGGAELVQQVGGELAGRPTVHGERVFIPRRDGLLDVDIARGTISLFQPWEASGGEGNALVAGGRVLIAAHRGVFAFGQPLAPSSPAPDLALAAASYAQREQASAALLAQGEGARGHLEPLLEHPDPEVRLRVQILLGELDRQARLVRWGPLIKDAWAAQVPDLLNRLTHPNPEVRLGALRKLGEVTDEQVTQLLLDLLDDDDPRVGFTAAVTLLARDDRTGIELVAQTLRQGAASDRLEGIAVLAKAGSDADAPLIAPALTAPEPEVRAAAAKAMLVLAQAAALDRVLPLLDDPDDQVRLAVLEGIREGGIDAQRAVRALAKAAQDPNDLIREQAIESLVSEQLRHPDVFQALGMALGDDVQRIAKKAGNRLFKLAQQASDDVLLIPPAGIERGARLKDPILRGYAAQIAMLYAAEQQARAQAQAEAAERHEAEGYHGSRPLSVETLTRFMADSNPKIRGLRVVGGPGWSQLFVARVRGQVLDAADVAAIGSLALDEDPRVRGSGYEGLAAALEAPGRGRLLAGSLTDSDAGLRERAAEWLAPVNAPTPLGPEGLAKVVAVSLRTAEGDPPGAEDAQRALDRLGPDHVSLWIGVLRGWPDPAVRAVAGQRLAQATEGRVAFDPEAEPGKMADAYQVWVWKRQHPDREPEDLLIELTSSNPSLRWKAAQAAAELPLPLIRNGIIASLGTERLDWVLKTKLEAAVAITGQRLGYSKTLKGPELRACAARFQRWLTRTLAAEATGRRP